MFLLFALGDADLCRETDTPRVAATLPAWAPREIQSGIELIAKLEPSSLP